MKKMSEKVQNDLEKAGKQVLDDDELDLINGGQRSALLANDEDGDLVGSEWCVLFHNCFAVAGLVSFMEEDSAAAVSIPDIH